MLAQFEAPATLPVPPLGEAVAGVATGPGEVSAECPQRTFRYILEVARVALRTPGAKQVPGDQPISRKKIHTVVVYGGADRYTVPLPPNRSTEQPPVAFLLLRPRQRQVQHVVEPRRLAPSELPHQQLIF